MTPQVVETALRAGVIAFAGSSRQMEGLYDLIALNVPECLPPGHTGKNGFVFVARWAGRFGVGRDINLKYAALDEPYLLASSYSTLDPHATQTEEHGWKTKGQLQALDKTLVDITFNSWRWPNFGWHVAVGLTPRPSIGGVIIHNPEQGVGAAISRIDRRQIVRSEAVVEYNHPYHILRNR